MYFLFLFFFFFFKQKTAYEISSRDWSSDVCSSDLSRLSINTELGLMIESRELAGQIVAQFEQFAASPNSYRLVLERDGPIGERIRWRTQLDGKSVDLDDDPDTTAWRRFE